VAIAEVPYTMSGKKMELPVKKILFGTPIEKAANVDSMRNPNSLQQFL
jgi:acetoacetyl-CoA synthetase